MKVILLQNVKNIGKKGDIKNVSDGFARNFLLKNNLGKAATDSAIKEAEKEKQKILQNEEGAKKELAVLAEKISAADIILKAKERDGKLFGSITKKIISEALRKENFAVSEDMIILNEPIKTTGEEKIKLDLGRGIKGEFVLKILPE